MLGVAYGASAIPAEWRRVLHGWPVLAARGLVALTTRIVKADKTFSYDIDPIIPVRHPYDDGVWLGDVAALQALPPGVDARCPYVVCRTVIYRSASSRSTSG